MRLGGAARTTRATALLRGTTASRMAGVPLTIASSLTKWHISTSMWRDEKTSVAKHRAALSAATERTPRGKEKGEAGHASTPSRRMAQMRAPAEAA